MQVYVYKNEAEVARAASMVFASEILKKPDCVIGLATGSTPVPTYQQLIKLNREGMIDFSRVRSFNLDEYVGLPEDHPCSYRYFMNDQLFNHINIDISNTHVPSGIAYNMNAAAAAYDKAIHEAGGIDLQLLGIGRNGHIGFNEPAEALEMGTHATELTDSTMAANGPLFDDPADMPRHALTMGLGGIFAAKKVLLIANGKNKHEAICGLLGDKLTTACPASLLKLHQNLILLCDKEAYNG